MPIYNGSAKQKELYFGSIKIKEAYYGSTKVFTVGYPHQTLLFESSTPGTYTLDVLYTTNVELWLVGAGGKGASYTPTGGGAVSSKYKRTQWAFAGGGSGGYIHGTRVIEPGTYTIIVGSANGGPTSCFGEVANGGGNGAVAPASATAGAGGTCTISVNTLTATTGANGSTATGRSATSSSGGSSRYNGYGQGGGSTSSGGSNGTNGYLKILVV